MKICYIARHDQVTTSNDDEGAIAHAFRVLGHEVTCVHEKNAMLCPVDGFDLMLFHKLENIQAIKRFEGRCKRAFWYFDLVDWPDDPAAARRSEVRKQWMHDVIPNVEAGFCTDGDWVTKWNLNHTRLDEQHGQDKLYILRQGADERVVGRGSWKHNTPPRILFVGGNNSSTGRRTFVDEMRAKHGPMFWQIANGIWRRDLADQIAGSQIVVCPDSPVTHNYWSNRVYIMMGFGAFILHPYCSDLVDELILEATDLPPLLWYDSREVMHDLIELFLPNIQRRKEIAECGLSVVKDRLLYRHRCQKLISIVEDL